MRKIHYTTFFERKFSIYELISSIGIIAYVIFTAYYIYLQNTQIESLELTLDALQEQLFHFKNEIAHLRTQLGNINLNDSNSTEVNPIILKEQNDMRKFYIQIVLGTLGTLIVGGTLVYIIKGVSVWSFFSSISPKWLLKGLVLQPFSYLKILNNTL